MKKLVLISLLAFFTVTACQYVANLLPWGGSSEEEIPTSEAEPTEEEVISTPEPIPFGGIYETDFSDFDDWFLWTNNNEETYGFDVLREGLLVTIPDADDWATAYYEPLYSLTDVRIESTVKLIEGTGEIYISLYCRSVEDGEYEFSLDVTGYWYIGKYIYYDEGDYFELASGESFAINTGNQRNELEAVCRGEELEFFINGKMVGFAADDEFKEGMTGFSVWTGEDPYAEVIIKDFVLTNP
jgi:hypothetical protein